MSLIKFVFSLTAFISLSFLQTTSFAADAPESLQDPLQHFRGLLTDQLNPNRATIERVFNPVGEGESLLVRAYVSGPQELVYRPLFSHAEDGSLISSSPENFILRTLPGTELKEVLINYEASKKHYELFFGNFRYSVSPDMSDISHISVRTEAAPFLSRNFQTLFIDQPSAALGVRYLFDQQTEQGTQAIIQLKKEYKDSTTGELMITSDGDILNQFRLEPYEAIHVEPVYFIEQYYLDTSGRIRYYIQPDGLQSYHLGATGEERAGNWISRRTMQKPRLFKASQTP